MAEHPPPRPERIPPDPEPGPEDLPSTEEAVRAHLAEAVRLFDAGSYHAAHEVLDELWLATQGEDSDFFKGLIQACIALYHWQRGNPAGARKLYAGHRRLLAAYMPAHRGLDVAGFLEAMQACLRPVVRARQGEDPAFDPGLRPRLSAPPSTDPAP